MNVRPTWLARAAGIATVAGVAMAALVALPTNAATAPLVLTVNGDVGMSTRTVAALDTIAAIKPAAHFAVGDLSYGVTGQEQAFCDLVTSRLGAGFPYELLTGNHESNGQNGNINDFGACLPNQLPGIVGTYGRQWYVDLPRESPKVRVLLISPGLTFPTGTLTYGSATPEYSWTANTIDAARAANIPWVIVGMHKPCLSLGNYGCDVGADLMNLLVDKKIDLVLTGHEHLYQRTKQVASAAGCPTVSAGTYNAACVADPDSDLVKGAGTVFVTAGTGGQEYRDSFPTDPEAGYFVTASSLAAPALGALKLSIVDDSLTGQFVATAPTTLTDSFTITKAPTPTASPSLTPTVTPTITPTVTPTITPTVTPTITPTGPPAPTPLAGDTFSRVVASGWGTADLGGAWTPDGTPTAFSVDGVAARIAIVAGATRVTTLPVSVQDATFGATIRWSQLPPAGSNYYAFAVARRTAALTDYRIRVRTLSDGSVRIGVIAMDGTWTARTIGAEVLVPGLSMAANAPVRLRYSVSGVSPTTIKVFATLPGQVLPVTPQLVVTDSQPSLQVAGRVGFGGTIGSTSPTVTLQADDVEVTAP